MLYTTEDFERAYKTLDEVASDFTNIEKLGDEMFYAVYNLRQDLHRAFENVCTLNHQLASETRTHDARLESAGIAYWCSTSFTRTAAQLDEELTKLQSLRIEVVRWEKILVASLH